MIGERVDRWGRVLARGMIRGYRGLVAPLLPSACRFHPTCSEYAHEALGRYSFLRAGRLSLARLLRCQPFHPGGYDPVPEHGDGPQKRRPAERNP